jgi:hypothetical protein
MQTILYRCSFSIKLLSGDDSVPILKQSIALAQSSGQLPKGKVISSTLFLTVYKICQKIEFYALTIEVRKKPLTKRRYQIIACVGSLPFLYADAMTKQEAECLCAELILKRDYRCGNPDWHWYSVRPISKRANRSVSSKSTLVQDLNESVDFSTSKRA